MAAHYLQLITIGQTRRCSYSQKNMKNAHIYYIVLLMNGDHRGGLGADLTRDSTRKATEMADKKR